MIETMRPIGANGETTRQEVLTALAWAAPLTTMQLWRIAAPGMRLTHFRDRVVAPLVRRGRIALVTTHFRPGIGHRLPERRVPPRQVGKVWQLSETGFAEIARSDKAPARPAIVRPSVLDHDLLLGEVVTRMIEWTRPFLSSLYLEHEERLDEQRRRPVADAMLVVRYEGGRSLVGVTPWKSLPPAPDEHVRLYAIEIDRGTEEYAVTDEKAVNYRRVRNDPGFYARYGGMFPVLLVVVPGEARLRRWHTGWRERWPYGKWLITTDARLARDEWFEYDNGRERWRGFADGWQAVSPGEAGEQSQSTPEPTRPLMTAWWADPERGRP